jgi:integrase
MLREFRGGRYVQRRLGVADDLHPADGATVLTWEQAQGEALAPGRPGLSRRHTVLDAWKAYVATRATPPDARELAIWRSFIEPKLGARDVADLSVHELEQWLAAQVTTHGTGRKRSPGGDAKDALRRARDTANRRLNLLKAVLNSSYRKDLVISADAWRKVRAFQRVDRPRTVTLTAAQARTLLAKLDEPLRSLARGALATGMRLGELQALRASDVEATRVRIRHGKSGERWVPLNDEGAKFFAERVAGRSPDALVFEPVSRMSVARGMRAGCSSAGIRPAATFHDLRRTWGSLMLNAGVPIEVVQEVLGHADARMTRRTYSHLLQQTVREAIEKHLPSFADKPGRRRR